MVSYLRLIRFPNLLFIAFIQFAMRQVVLMPLLQTYGFDEARGTGMLSLLIAATVFIAAGGYILNDYFDVKIDAINHPDKQIVGNIIPRRRAMMLHMILSGCGIGCGLLLAFFARSFTLAFIFIVVPGLLWFYSSSYKRQFLTGNLIVAFLAMLTVLIVSITELAFLHKEYGDLIRETPIPRSFYSWTGGFAFFSFLCTWIREIIKDMEDEKGDRELECRTMPIKWGIAKTKVFVYILCGLTVMALYIANALFIPFEGTLTLRYITFGITLPFVVLIYLIVTAKNSVDFRQASTLVKVIMLIGTLYSFIFYFLLAKTHGISLFNLFFVK